MKSCHTACHWNDIRNAQGGRNSLSRTHEAETAQAFRQAVVSARGGKGHPISEPSEVSQIRVSDCIGLDHDGRSWAFPLRHVPSRFRPLH